MVVLKPLHGRVAVRRLEAEEKTAGGIIVPNFAQEKPQQGEVVAVGDGLRSDGGGINPIDVKLGDRILFGKFSSTEMTINGEALVIINESDIMGVVS